MIMISECSVTKGVSFHITWQDMCSQDICSYGMEICQIPQMPTSKVSFSVWPSSSTRKNFVVTVECTYSPFSHTGQDWLALIWVTTKPDVAKQLKRWETTQQVGSWVHSRFSAAFTLVLWILWTLSAATGWLNSVSRSQGEGTLHFFCLATTFSLNIKCWGTTGGCTMGSDGSPNPWYVCDPIVRRWMNPGMVWLCGSFV